VGAYDAALHSPSLNCSRPFNDTAVTRFPRDETQFARLVAHNRTAAASCVEGSGDLIGNLDAANQARDAEALRAALGEAKLSWFAWTYGNLVAQTYAKLYPGRVRAMVVDSPLDHTVSTSEYVRTQAGTTEEAFQRFIAWCDRTPCGWDMCSRAAERPKWSSSATVTNSRTCRRRSTSRHDIRSDIAHCAILMLDRRTGV
jgi:pimeloyl-ACP methyl ester carboxylesterase